MVYYNFRHFNSFEGKWITKDNIMDVYNLYEALKNNPSNTIDIKGEWFWMVIPILMYGISNVNAPGIYDDPSPEPPSGFEWAIAIDILSGIAVTGILKIGGCIVSKIKFTIYSTRASRVPVSDIIKGSGKARASSIAFDARTGRMEIGVSGKARGEIVIDRDKALENLIEQTKQHFGNSLGKRYPVGNCAEADAVNKLLKKGSMLSDIRIEATYANREAAKALSKKLNAKKMQPCEYCEFMFEHNIHAKGVKIETPTIYILPDSSSFMNAENIIGNGW